MVSSRGLGDVYKRQPEPSDPDAPEYTREDEERDMVDQSMEAGELDRRNPTEVAMDLLAEELGARPL